ncbi:MAG: hypothetical protein GF311_00465 [Candidatus Lokiarchaeota archaeon]|nr:hypothetical protein [Candidatus Lokiarchaeota archaeon]
MPKVTLHLLNIFALRTGQNAVEYEGNTIQDVISQFVKDYKNKLDESLLNKSRTKLNPQILILLDGRDVKYKKNYDTQLKNGDKIYLSYPISGG